jgi:outer membrane protein OmpU
MNNFKKIGLSALAGSLAAITTAGAVEMGVSGSAKVTYLNGDQTEVTGNPFGMNTSLGFSGTGDVNGYATTLFIQTIDKFGGMTSASLSMDMGDMGKITFDQGTGAGGISTIDDKTPSANEEVWDGLDAVTGDANGLVGGGNNGAFVYANSYGDTAFTGQITKGASSANSDDATSGEGSTGTSWDFALTNASLADGLDVGIGYGEISNAKSAGANDADDSSNHRVAYVTYSMGMATVGITKSEVEDATEGGDDEEATGFGIAVNVMDGLSVSYGEREIDHSLSTKTSEDQEGIAIAYTVGAAKVSVQQNKTSNNAGTSGTNDEMTEIALSLSF